ncbi:MAG: hypothetical protein M3Q49_21760 [Actinomycetota bacterium]|nr:hypothetical protein [Actinomycetota bacterium]
MQPFFDVVREVALTIAFGASVLVAVSGWTEAVLLCHNEKARRSNLLVRLFIGAVYTIAALGGLESPASGFGS